MVGNLHQWLTTQNEVFLSEFDEFSTSTSLPGGARRLGFGAASTNRGASMSMQTSLESLKMLSPRPKHELSPIQLRGATELKSPLGAATLLAQGKVYRVRPKPSQSLYESNAAITLDTVGRKSHQTPSLKTYLATERNTMDTGVSASNPHSVLRRTIGPEKVLKEL